MKRAFFLFWKGLTALLTGIAGWFTVVLGMRDDSKYGKVLRRVVGSCFAFLMLLLAIAAGWDFGRTVWSRLGLNASFDETYSETLEITPSVTYYSYFDDHGYVKTSDGKTTIKDIKWIALPLGEDTLICYSDGQKRGYFSMFTGKPVIRPKYAHAWIFSDGLAAVDEDGWIKFIDASGKVVIDPKTPYTRGTDGNVFHNGFCVVYNDSLKRYGLIDKRGSWVLEPEYLSIDPQRQYWVVDNGAGKCVLDSALNAVLPFTQGRVWVTHDHISIILNTHVMQRYDLSGKLVSDFYIQDVRPMTYDSDELHYPISRHYTEEATYNTETEDTGPQPVKKTAKCRCYEAEYGWFGLITADGKVITQPSYSSIKAIDYDLYLCKDNDEDGIILNGKGERIK